MGFECRWVVEIDWRAAGRHQEGSSDEGEISRKTEEG
jgi:hypothetical protein